MCSRWMLGQGFEPATIDDYAVIVRNWLGAMRLVVPGELTQYSMLQVLGQCAHSVNNVDRVYGIIHSHWFTRSLLHFTYIP